MYLSIKSNFLTKNYLLLCLKNVVEWTYKVAENGNTLVKYQKFYI